MDSVPQLFYLDKLVALIEGKTSKTNLLNQDKLKP